MRFPAAVVRQHAGAVSEAADQMAVARSAVREVSMDHQAYGEICQFLPGMLSPLFSGAVDILNGAVDALSETALKLRATAASMEAVDVDSAGRLTEVGRGPELPL
ncbi:type VII secretion target [Actinoplanes sp. NEAU-A12]|uniref:Type VII secretion target n=1 Tax=Actinoplanes sandaracinus TaxID=3045177 RepID=A0ABT6WC04_9ACTN|nr:type VII secretion target [Actinoplanes sandaracinus]MDI6097239.1 type VII secretion target [Actinoplanes sandaracinus]